MNSEYDKLAGSVGVRLTVGQLTLDQYVGVRILYPQLAKEVASPLFLVYNTKKQPFQLLFFDLVLLILIEPVIFIFFF